MALGKTITIEIIDNNIDRDESTPAQQAQNKEPKAKKTSTKKEKSSVNAIGMYAFNNAKNQLVSAVTSTFNRQVTLNENYLAQNNLNVAKKSLGLVTSLASALKTGQDVGGGAGMAVAAVAWGVTQYVSYQNRMSSYYQQLNSNNFNTEFSQVRAGLINNGRGTEN